MKNISKIKNHFKENQLFLNRMVFATIIVIILIAILIGRIFYLQIYKYDLYRNLAKNNQVRLIPIPPTRGLIFDRNGILLAENIPSFSLTITPYKIKNLTKTIDDLKKIIPITDKEINLFKKQIKFKGKYESIPIKNKLTEKEVAKFSVEKYKFKGINIKTSITRKYNFKKVLSHALGYVGPISYSDLKNINIAKYRGIFHIGKIGIEKFYEKYLKGEIGYKHVETNSKGRILRTLKKNPSIPGHDLYLSIDSQLQSFIYNEMKNKEGAIVAIEPKTGDILAMISAPSFDPNLFVQGINEKNYKKLKSNPQKPLFNKAINGQYPPGSTIKPIVALKALEDKIINKNTLIFDPGFFQINNTGRKFRGWKKDGHGIINVENAIAESSTVYFFKLGDKMGINKIYKTFTDFGLGKKTNIDLHSESHGIAPNPNWKKRIKKQKWFKGETLNSAIGQGYTLTTPLQIANMASTIANNGILIEPKLLHHMQNKTTLEKIFKERKKNEIKFKNPKNLTTIINGMLKATKSRKGTAYNAFADLNISVAGKTGTAQVFSLKKDQKYEKGKLQKKLRDHSWFIAFAPLKNPKIALAVILEHDETGASKVAKKIIKFYLSQKNINKSKLANNKINEIKNKFTNLNFNKEFKKANKLAKNNSFIEKQYFLTKNENNLFNKNQNFTKSILIKKNKLKKQKKKSLQKNNSSKRNFFKKIYKFANIKYGGTKKIIQQQQNKNKEKHL